MGDIVDLKMMRVQRQLERLLREPGSDLELPSPEELGWHAMVRDDAGRVLRYVNLRYQAIVGYVPGAPELVYLDYQHRCLAFESSLEALLLGIEVGAMPDPVAEVD